MADQWYVKKGGKKHGPFSTDQLKKLATSGKIDRADLLWKEGMEKWVACGSAKGLFAAEPAAARPAVPPPPPPANPLDDFDAGHPAAAFADFETPAYVPTPEAPPPLAAAPPPTAAYTPIKAAKRMDYAGLGSRVLAQFIDSILVGGIPGAVLILLFFRSAEDPERLKNFLVVWQPVSLVLITIYATAMEWGNRGATIGKQAMSIRVTDLEGRPIGVGKALLRNVAKAVPMVVFVSVILVLIMPRKQAGQDLLAGTVVVKA